MTERRARDEGALQTKVIMSAVKSARLAKQPLWSAERLAEEMTKVGVPWNADIVVNLEHGRRKSLRVHELLALAWVLDVDNPLDLLVPGARTDRDSPMYPVTPDTLLFRDAVRGWVLGETGPLRSRLAQTRDGEPEDLAEVLKDASPLLRQQILLLARSSVRNPREGDDGPR